MRKLVLDHDIVISNENKVFVVIGNYHPKDYLLAYVKYIPTRKNTIWHYGNFYYERVVKEYSIKRVLENCNKNQECVYNEDIDTIVPIIRRSKIKRHLIPEIRAKEINESSKDSLERIFSSLYKEISNLGVSKKLIGVTGSLLVGMHNPLYSDINMIIYNYKGIKSFIEISEKIGESLPEGIKLKIIKKQFVKRKLSKGLFDVIVPKFRRFLYRCI